VSRALATSVFAAALAAFAFGIYHLTGYLNGSQARVVRPTSTTVAPLQGTIYFAQQGAIYRLRGGAFQQITPDGGWMQPSVSPDGSTLVAVKRDVDSSDLYEVLTNGRGQTRLTNNTNHVVEHNHWAFYPRFSADGSRVYYSYDPKDPDNSYRVDFAIYTMGTPPNPRSVVAWSTPNQYTGGDVEPLPLTGGLVYTKFSIDDQSVVHSQIWFQRRAGSPGVPLTAASADCSQAAVTADGQTLAMVCRHGAADSASLEVAPLDLANLTLGQPRTLVGGMLLAWPTFSPDGKTVAFLAPANPGGPFQLWTVAAALPAAPTTRASTPAAAPKPTQVTDNLSFDSNSAPTWVAG
jgi:Tol biopolymer transport system component